MAHYYDCTWEKIDNEPPGKPAVTKRENVLGQEWRRSRAKDVVALRRKKAVGF
jgi:hypothetical protein